MASLLSGMASPQAQKTIKPIPQLGATPPVQPAAPQPIAAPAPTEGSWDNPYTSPAAPAPDPYRNVSYASGTEDPRNAYASPVNGDMPSWVNAASPGNLSALTFQPDELKKFGYSGSSDWSNPYGSYEDPQPGQGQTDFANWLDSSGNKLQGSVSSDLGMTSSLQDPSGKTLLQGSSGNDDTFWKGALLAAGGTLGALGAAGEFGTLGELTGGATDAWGETIANSVNDLSLSNVGAATESVPFNAAMDSQAYNAAVADGLISAPTLTGAGGLPSSVNLVNAGGTMATGAGAGGLTSQIGSALSAAKSGLGSVAEFAKANPQLAALGAGGAAQLLNGSGGDPPAIPGSGGGAGGTSNDALIKALTDKLYGPNGSMSNSFDYSSVPGLKTSAGEVGQFNQSASDAAYGNATRYLDPQIAQQQKALESRLADQGFVPGTPAYNQAMQNFMDTNQRAYASARDTATTAGFTQGNNQFNQSLSNANLNNSASREQLAQLLAERNQPLNELNSLKTGQQLSYENQLGQYNADVSSKNSTNQALSQLALALGIYLG